MHRPVEDGIGERGIADAGVPVGHWQLAGEQQGAHPVAGVADLQKVAPFGFLSTAREAGLCNSNLRQ